MQRKSTIESPEHCLQSGYEKSSIIVNCSFHHEPKQSYQSEMPTINLPSLFFIIFFILFKTATSIADSEALLKLKESFTNADGLDSWKPETNACASNNQWVGVVCGSGVVNGIHLGYMNLSGNIDVEALIQIPGLRSLSFRDNSFSGNLPGFNRLIALRGIFLSGNQFSGEIPSDYFLKMESLKKVFLSDNRFTGKIPSSLAQLPHLIELHLENNQFSGPVPSFQQITLMDLDLSNNSLSGEIPSSLSRFNAKVFEGNNGLCGEKLSKQCIQSTPLSEELVANDKNNNISEETEDSSRKISFGFLIISAIMLAFMIIGIYVLKRRQEQDFDWMEREHLEESVRGSSRFGGSKKENIITVSQKRSGSNRKGKGSLDLVMINDEKGEFVLTDLMKAAAEVLGNGALGSSYKATLFNGLTVVVKRIKDMNRLGKDDFETEMMRLGELKHINVFPPLAYHYRKEEKLLVYEYMPMQSLLYLLHGDRGPAQSELNWPARLKIIQGIARGLGYLHSELSSYDLPHGDLKSSNVLLSLNYEPLLADYGFDMLLNSNQARQSLIAYKTPEAQQSNQVSPKCDVYCLGIIILELITGKFISQYLSHGNGGTDIIQWVRSAISEGKENEIFDPEIASYVDSHEEIGNLLRIGAACTETNPLDRIDVTEAVNRVEEIQIGGQDANGYADSIASHSRRLSQPER